MTNQQGAPEALRTIARYKIGYATDDWGMRSSTPSGIPDHAGAWVRYEDHVAALVEAQQPAHTPKPAPATQQAEEVEFDGYKGHENVRWYINNLQRIGIVNQWFADGYCNKLREFFTSEHRRNGQKERDAERMAANDLRALASKVRNLADEFWSPGENMPEQFVGIHDTVTERLLSVLTPQPSPTPQADSQPAPVVDALDAALEAVRKRLCAMQRYSFVLDDDGVVRRVQDRTGNWIEFDEAHALLDPVAVDAAVNADRAARAPADSVTAPAGGDVVVPTWKPLRYATPRDLWKAFKGGAKFVLHYHGKAYPVERMQARETVVYVQPPGMPVKLYPDGQNCESAGDAIWLEELATTPAQAADSVLEDAARLLRQILAASQDGDSDTHLSAHFVKRIQEIANAGGAR